MMTLFDSDKQIAATLSGVGKDFQWCTTSVNYNTFSGEIEAVLQSEIRKDDPWLTKESILFETLTTYYEYILCSLDRNGELDPSSIGKYNIFLTSSVLTEFIAYLHWKWDLLPRYIHFFNPTPSKTLQCLTEHDILYLDRGHEHEMKNKLVGIWSRWIREDMTQLLTDARNDCHEALAVPNSEKAKWESTELDCLAAWEWTRREQGLLVSSMAVEAILYRRMEGCISKIHSERKDDRLRDWMKSEFHVGQRMRLEKERQEAKERMEGTMRNASDRAERKGRSWKVHGNLKKFVPKWQDGQKFIEEQWSSAIDGGFSAQDSSLGLDTLINQNVPWSSRADDQPRLRFIHSIKQRFSFWHPQREIERCEMDATIQAIHDPDAQRSRGHQERAYSYPEPDREATRRFSMLKYSESKGKLCSAVVYDVRDCEQDVVNLVISKPTTQSVINVRPDIVPSIPENPHLLFLSCSRGQGEEPPFVPKNRDQWWDRQTGNASIFYFTPDGLSSAAVHTYTSAPIAHILIHLTSPSRVRLRMLHRADSGISVVIQEGLNEFLRTSEKISQNLQLQDLDAYDLQPGRHILQVVPHRDSTDNHGHYCLRDIFVEFLEPTLKLSVER